MIELIFMGVFLALLFIGGVLADYVLPGFAPLEKYLEQLPLMTGMEPAQAEVIKDAAPLPAPRMARTGASGHGAQLLPRYSVIIQDAI